MYHPTTRVLTVLELLQAHTRMTGPQLAERLEVDVRTARRYVTMLQDLGIPVEAERGRHGGYTLRPGFKLPPLMFTEDEALALTLGLLSARKLMLAPTAPAIEGALAKIERVLPDAVRTRVQSIQETVALNLGEPDSRPHADVVATLSTAAQQRRRVRIGYRSATGDHTKRDVDPYGLAYQDGRWYLAGHCHLRAGLRTFRLDRVVCAEAMAERFEPPAEFDTLSHVIQSLAAKPGSWPTEVLLHTTLQDTREMIPSAFASLQETPEGVVLRANINSLPWMARFLANLGCSFIVRQPAELRQELRRHAAEIVRFAGLD